MHSRKPKKVREHAQKSLRESQGLADMLKKSPPPFFHLCPNDLAAFHPEYRRYVLRQGGGGQAPCTYVTELIFHFTVRVYRACDAVYTLRRKTGVGGSERQSGKVVATHTLLSFPHKLHAAPLPPKCER